MWIVRGVLAGLALFVIGSVIYIITEIQMSSAPATGSTAIESWTIQNPVYWTALVLAVVISCWIARWKSQRRSDKPSS